MVEHQFTLIKTRCSLLNDHQREDYIQQLIIQLLNKETYIYDIIQLPIYYIYLKKIDTETEKKTPTRRRDLTPLHGNFPDLQHGGGVKHREG